MLYSRTNTIMEVYIGDNYTSFVYKIIMYIVE